MNKKLLSITIIIVILVTITLSIIKSENEVSVDQVKVDAMTQGMDNVLNNEYGNKEKVNMILDLFAKEINEDSLSSYELNLVINKYEEALIEKILDSNVDGIIYSNDMSLNRYANSFKIIKALRMISGYTLKPWQNIETIHFDGENIMVNTNTQQYIIENEAIYFSSDISRAEEYETLPKYFNFDAWLSLLANVYDQYPDDNLTKDNLINGLNIIKQCMSEKDFVEEMNILFTAYSYGYNDVEYKTIDGITILVMIIEENNQVIDLKPICELGSKYSLNEGVDYLNKTYGKAKGNDLDVMHDWLDVPMNNPITGKENLSRSDVMDNIRDSVVKSIKF